MPPEHIESLGVAPRLADQTGHSVAKHCRSMVDRKQRIITDLFELPLTTDAGLATLECNVRNTSQDARNGFKISRGSVGCNLSTWGDHGAQMSHGYFRGFGAFVRTRAVLALRNFFKWMLRRHDADIKIENFARLGANSQRHRHGFALGVNTRLHVIKLDVTEISDIQRLEVSFGPEAIHPRPVCHRGAVDPERSRNAALRALVGESHHDVVTVATQSKAPGVLASRGAEAFFT